ncbi:MAG: isocitrate/isopropylmalate dehydrogenase family protein [Lachnospiraceae bacterium]|nr:isocitrate/isopropylmalate dehydrogenase family protein [Lachnospiraceae bacterium]
MKIGVIKGNGIGPEITEATLHVLEAIGIDFEWVSIAIGDEGVEKYGHPLSQEAVQQVKDVKVAIKAPLIVNKMKGRLLCIHKDGSEHIYPSLNNAIRRELGLYICPRPIKGVKNISEKYEKLDVAIMREITEDVYAGIEHKIGDDVAECIKLVTRKAATRAAEFGFDYAIKNGRKRVTCVHKANAISLSDGLFLKCFKEVAQKYPDIESNDYMVDATAFYLAKKPELLDVIVTSNQYGDILSDLAAGLVGSLGLAPGANIGEDVAVFEASHGAAPDIAGKGIANPVALILSGALMLRHIGKTTEANWVEESTFEILSEKQTITPDLGGKASTMELAEAIAKRVKEKSK